MKEFRFDEKKKTILRIISIFVAALIRFININAPIGLDMHGFRQTETAIVIQGFFREGISMFNYEIPVFGNPWTFQFEFPIYQAIVYFIMKLLRASNIDFWCRTVSIFVFLLSAVALWFWIVDVIAEKKYADIICIVYLFLPYNIYWSRAALIDYLSVLFAILYSFYLYRWMKNRKIYMLCLSMFFGILAYLQKSTTMFPFVTVLAYLIIQYFVKDIKKKEALNFEKIKKYLGNNILFSLLLILDCIVPVIICFFWNKHADQVKSAYRYTDWLNSNNIKDWNFGTIQQRLDWTSWKVLYERISAFFGGTIFFLLFLAVFFIVVKNKKIIIINLLSIFLTISIIFNLYYVHNYYLIALSPFVCVVIGVGICDLFEQIMAKKYHWAFFLVFMLLWLGAICIKNTDYLEGSFKNTGVNKEALGYDIKNLTNPSERVIVDGFDWNPFLLYYGERKGFMIVDDCKEKYSADYLYDDVFLKDDYKLLVTTGENYSNDILRHYHYFFCQNNLDMYMIRFADDNLWEKIIGLELKKGIDDEGTVHVDIPNDSFVCFKREDASVPLYCSLNLLLDNNTIRQMKFYIPEGEEEIWYYFWKLDANVKEIQIDNLSTDYGVELFYPQ